MMSVTRHDLIPSDTLIAACAPDDPLERAETHLDCYTADVESTVDLGGFIEAFYTSLPFRIERRILSFAAHLPSTDAEVRALAAGEVDQFAAWTVESRKPDEILLRDMEDKTKSWLRVEPASGGAGTRLYFGSVVTASIHPRTGKPHLGRAFRAFMPVHGMYSRILLGSARARLARTI